MVPSFLFSIFRWTLLWTDRPPMKLRLEWEITGLGAPTHRTTHRLQVPPRRTNGHPELAAFVGAVVVLVHGSLSVTCSQKTNPLSSSSFSFIVQSRFSSKFSPIRMLKEARISAESVNVFSQKPQSKPLMNGSIQVWMYIRAALCQNGFDAVSWYHYTKKIIS